MSKFKAGDYARVMKDGACGITKARAGDIVRIEDYGVDEYVIEFVECRDSVGVLDDERFAGLNDVDGWALRDVDMEPCDPPGSASFKYTNPFADKVAEVLAKVQKTLVEKNLQYGDSALNPVRVFSKADATEQIKVRIDDKISRLQRGIGENNEDTVLDLMGYLVLLRIAEAK